MIIGRFKVQARSESAAEVSAALAAVEAPSRLLPGVVHFDVARSLSEPDTFVVLEVFDDREAFDRQEAQQEVAAVLRLVDEGALVQEAEWTVWKASELG